MSKLDNNVVNYIKLLSLDMVREGGCIDYKTAFDSASIFYALYMYHFNFDRKNENYINHDRIVVTPSFLPSLYSALHLFGFNISLDNLNEYNKFDSITRYLPSRKTSGVDVYTDEANILGISSGIAYGEQYLENIVKKEIPKSNLISFHTYVVCKYSDMLNGNNLETLYYITKYKLNKLHLILLKDIDEKDERLLDCFEALDIESIECDNSINSLDKAIDDAKNSKSLSVIIVKPVKDKDNLTFTPEDITKLKLKYKIEDQYNINNTLYKEINEEIDKRINKKLSKWEEEKNNALVNEKVKNIIDFMITKDINININVDNIKINDTYDEELIKGNNKILNLVASKSPFIFSLSNDFNTTLCDIKDNNRNILINNISTLNNMSIGLANLGFKVFTSLPLIYSSYIHSNLKNIIDEELPITYIFTQDNILNTYKNNMVTYELNSLRLVPNLINFRPCDINEIIGVYSIVSKLNKPCTITIGSEKVPKLLNTNPKYVVAGAYRIKRERGEANGILIASGEEVHIALKLAEELLPYNIDLRVVTIPSRELFESQVERYQYTLLPHELKTFVLEYSNTNLWRGYATSEKYVLGVDNYTTNGTREELLNYYNLDMDSLKARIIELMKES